jgi:hypothetical protein
MAGYPASMGAIAEPDQFRGGLRRRGLVGAASIVVAAALVGCAPVATPVPTLPRCAEPAQTAELPGDFPAIPFPPGTVISGSSEETQAGSETEGAEAVLPLTLPAAKDYYLSRLPEIGLPIRSQTSGTDFAQLEFAGGGLQGELRLGTIVGCDGAVRASVAVTLP